MEFIILAVSILAVSGTFNFLFWQWLKLMKMKDSRCLNIPVIIKNEVDLVCLLHNTCPIRDGNKICTLETDCEDMQTDL